MSSRVFPECDTLQALFAKDGRWSPGVWARDKDGNQLKDPAKRHAHGVAFDLMGAVYLIYDDQERSEIFYALRMVISIRENRPLDRVILVPWEIDPKRTIQDIRDVCKEAKV